VRLSNPEAKEGSGSASDEKTSGITRRKLWQQVQAERFYPVAAQVVIEIAQHRAKREGFDAGLARAEAKALRPGSPRAVGIGCDVKPPQSG